MSTAQVVEFKNSKTIPVSDVVFRQDLYPRIETSAVTVQKYAEDLSVLPPIEVNQHKELIDGWHRWTAHKKAGVESIPCVVTTTESESEFLELAIERNAKHGLQLSQTDKEKYAGRLYSAFLASRPSIEEREAYKGRLAKLFSVSTKSISRWTSRDEKEYQRELEKTAFEMWMLCSTQEEIVRRVGWSEGKVVDFLRKRQLSISEQTATPEYTRAHHADEGFQVPIYNVWKQQEKTTGSDHFGNSDVRWVDNLLYLYTQPFDIVVDPFAGGGSTIDICKKRFRRYWVSDRKPVPEREHQIRNHDLTSGIPMLPRWQDVKLVYLDPPYWKQAEGKYSNDSADLANMPLEKFTETLAGIINSFAKKLKPGAMIALLLQPTQWKAPERQYTDHVADMIRAIKLPINMRVQCPYESQQCTAQMVEWAKQNRKLLVISRELVIWRV
jgi:DNA modification methylase